MLIRFAKRLSAWEGDPDVPTLKQTEFKHRNGGVDLRPSVYKLDDGSPEHVQAYAEHAHKIDPPGTALGLEIVAHDRSRVVETPGDTPFSFTRNNHREVQLDDEGELDELVQAAKLAARHRIAKRDVCEYVRGRLSAEDVEWVAHAQSGTAKPWVTNLLPSIEVPNGPRDDSKRSV